MGVRAGIAPGRRDLEPVEGEAPSPGVERTQVRRRESAVSEAEHRVFAIALEGHLYCRRPRWEGVDAFESPREDNPPRGIDLDVDASCGLARLGRHEHPEHATRPRV